MPSAFTAHPVPSPLPFLHCCRYLEMAVDIGCDKTANYITGGWGGWGGGGGDADKTAAVLGAVNMVNRGLTAFMLPTHTHRCHCHVAATPCLAVGMPTDTKRTQCHACAAPCLAAGMVRGVVSSVVIDMGIVLEGTASYELPEHLLGTIRCANRHTGSCLHLHLPLHV